MGRKRKTDKHLPKNVYLRSGSYYFVDYQGKWINLGRTFAGAMTKYGQIADVGECSTMADVIERYMREIAPAKAASTYKDNTKQAKYLRAAFGRMRPAAITPQAAYKYLDERGKRSKVQANRELALLSHMFKKAIRWGVASHNPCVGVERFKETPRTRYVTDDEFNAFKEFAGVEIAAYLDFKLLTGLRKGDILRLRLSDIQEDGIHAHISKTK